MKTEGLDENMVSNPLTHPRRSAIKCWDELLQGCKTLSTFIGRIEKYSKIIHKAESLEEVENLFDEFGPDGANNFKGDVTEVFAEFTIKEYSRAWGILNYCPILTLEENDVGVDGLGNSEEGENITVQIKYGTWQTIIDYDRLDTFHCASIYKYDDAIMFVFTLAKTIHYEAFEDFHGELKFISLAEFSGVFIEEQKTPSGFYSLKKACNNKPDFWAKFLKEVQK